MQQFVNLMIWFSTAPLSYCLIIISEVDHLFSKYGKLWTTGKRLFTLFNFAFFLSECIQIPENRLQITACIKDWPGNLTIYIQKINLMPLMIPLWPSLSIIYINFTSKTQTKKKKPLKSLNLLACIFFFKAAAIRKWLPSIPSAFKRPHSDMEKENTSDLKSHLDSNPGSWTFC